MSEFLKIVKEAAMNAFHPYRVACAIAGGIGTSMHFSQWTSTAIMILLGFFIADILATLCGDNDSRKRCSIIILPPMFVSLLIIMLDIAEPVTDIASATFGVTLFMFIGAMLDPNFILFFSSRHVTFDIEDDEPGEKETDKKND